MTTAQSDVVAIYEEHGGLLRGHFTLSSGLHSPEYWQSALVLSHPDVAEQFGAALAERCRALAPTVVVGPAMGGLIIAHEVARALGRPMIFTERIEGAMALRRGFQVAADDRLLIVEDVISTGGSVKEVIAELAVSGAHVVGVASIVDRSSGAAQFGVPYESLAQVPVVTYAPEDCPLCREGSEAVKPGSRPNS